jgi:hypothetical protein
MGIEIAKVALLFGLAAASVRSVASYEVVEPPWIEGGYVEPHGADVDALLAQFRPVFAKARGVSGSVCGDFHVYLLSRSLGPETHSVGSGTNDGCYIMFDGPIKIQFLSPEETRTYAFEAQTGAGVSGVCFVTRLERRCLIAPMGGLYSLPKPGAEPRK